MKLVEQKESKKCAKCGEEKPAQPEYWTSRDGRLRGTCRACTNKSAIERQRLVKFGITADDYNAMYDKQNGCCACCGTHQLEQDKSMAVDHCHDTGKIRGLLCFDCNVGIGKLGDNLDGVMNAVKYLKEVI